MTETERRRVIEDARIAKQIEELHNRVFDGLGQELRKEIKEDIGKVTRLIVAMLISMILALSGIIIEGRLSSSSATKENYRNYEAIIDLSKNLELHIKGPE